MAETPKVYVICDSNCKFEGMTKEQIFTAIKQAVEGGEIKDVDAGFITTIKTINGLPLKFFVGTQEKYNTLSTEEKINLFAIITNDTTKEALEKAINDIEELEKFKENELLKSNVRTVSAFDNTNSIGYEFDVHLDEGKAYIFTFHLQAHGEDVGRYFGSTMTLFYSPDNGRNLVYSSIGLLDGYDCALSDCAVRLEYLGNFDRIRAYYRKKLESEWTYCDRPAILHYREL